jgi:hypothetical protein
MVFEHARTREHLVAASLVDEAKEDNKNIASLQKSLRRRLKVTATGPLMALSKKWTLRSEMDLTWGEYLLEVWKTKVGHFFSFTNLFCTVKVP